jgi:ATP-binding protein involved in chromosome partitioning
MVEASEAAVLAALKTIADPDRGGNIVDLGMVSGLALRGGHVAFAIEVDRARAPKLEGLRAQAERPWPPCPGILSVPPC